MPRVQWPLRHGRPCVQVVLALAQGAQQLVRTLLADTGAGSQQADIDLLLEEDDCLLCGGYPGQPVTLGGAYAGSFPTYDLLVFLPALAFAKHLRVVGVPAKPAGFDGIACFRFLNRFTYGNWGDPGQFGLEL
jgi:hypothetical protein